MMEIALILLLGGAVYYVVRSWRSQRVLTDVGWEVGGLAGPTLASELPDPVTVDPASVRVSTSLARIEGPRLLASPLFIVGVLLSMLAALSFLGESTPEEFEWLGLVTTRLPLAVYPLCGMLLLAVNRAVLRARRDGCEELFESLPAPRAARSTGHMLSLWAPLLVGVGFVALFVLAIVAGSGKPAGTPLFAIGPLEESLPPAAFAYAAAAVVLVACAGLLGIGMARLVPYALAAFGAVILVGFITAQATGPDMTNAVRSLSPYSGPREVPDLFAIADPWEHVVYLIGLAAIAVGATWLLDGARRPGGLALGLGVVIAVGAWASPEIFVDESRIDRVAAAVSRPLEHQACTEKSDVTYCAYEPFERFTDDWIEVVEPVLAAAPPSVRARGLAVEQRPSPVEVEKLDPRVRERLEPASLGSSPWAWSADDRLHPDLRWGHEGHVPLAITAGSWAVGLPAAPNARGPCYAGGQARSVVALWLAAQGMGVTEASTWYRSPETEYKVFEFNDDRYIDLLPVDWSTNAVPAVVWDTNDRAMTRTLLSRPVDEVRATLHANWDTVTDPATTSDELGELFDLDAGTTNPGPKGFDRCT